MNSSLAEIRLCPHPWRCLGPEFTLLPPERFDQAGGPCNDILERDDLIRRHSASQNTTLRQPDGQSVTGTRGNSVVNETVCTEPTNAIELLAGFQIAFRHRHDFADRAGEGCDS